MIDAKGIVKGVLVLGAIIGVVSVSVIGLVCWGLYHLGHHFGAW